MSFVFHGYTLKPPDSSGGFVLLDILQVLFQYIAIGKDSFAIIKTYFYKILQVGINNLFNTRPD